MGKCLAGCDQPYVEIKVCDTCFHKDVCGDKDYLTENNCFDFCSKDEIQRWKDLAEQGMLVEIEGLGRAGFRKIVNRFMKIASDEERIESAKLNMMQEIEIEAEARLAELEGK